LKKVVARRIEDHIKHTDFIDTYQSTYRRGHSTEIYLLKVYSDIVEALDEAIAVIDHPILLKRLEVSFGIKEKALTWVKSYFADTI